MSYQIDQSGKDVFSKKTFPNRILKLTEIVEVLKKTDGRLRECLPARRSLDEGGSTLVDAQPRSMVKRYHRKYKKSI